MVEEARWRLTRRLPVRVIPERELSSEGGKTPLGKTLHLVATIIATVGLLVAGAASAQAAAPYGWTYSYAVYSSGSWHYSQSTTNAARNWPAAGYSTSSSYYRLGNSLNSTFKSRSRTAADTWSAVDTLFHFFELPLGGNSTDHTLGMNDTLQYPALNSVDYRWDSANNRAYIHNWYIRFKTSLTDWGWYWVDGSASNGVDIQSVATHEFGHSVMLEDLVGAWGDSTRPTMYGFVIPGNTSLRTLAAGDVTGIGNLY